MFVFALLGDHTIIPLQYVNDLKGVKRNDSLDLSMALTCDIKLNYTYMYIFQINYMGLLFVLQNSFLALYTVATHTHTLHVHLNRSPFDAVN